MYHASNFRLPVDTEVTEVPDLLQLIKCHQLTPYAFADDTQIYGFCRPHEVSMLADRVSDCVDKTSAWMMANRLQ